MLSALRGLLGQTAVGAVVRDCSGNLISASSPAEKTDESLRKEASNTVARIPAFPQRELAQAMAEAVAFSVLQNENLGQAKYIMELGETDRRSQCQRHGDDQLEERAYV